ncbi:MAG: DUF4271 domain-containing protein [Bacteroidota bacterium]
MNPIYRNITNLDWITLLLVLSVLLLSLSKYFFKGHFFNFIILPFNNKYITLNKKKGKLFQGFHIIMSIFQMTNMALFIFVAQNLLQKQPPNVYSDFYPIILGSLLVYFFIKIGLQMGNGYFFENHGLMTGLIFEKLSYFNYGGLIAFLGNILMIYVFPDSITIIYLVILLLLIINGIGMIKILRNLQKLIMSNTFYFILYLCTLEISPIAIIISYLNS